MATEKKKTYSSNCGFPTSSECVENTSPLTNSGEQQLSLILGDFDKVLSSIKEDIDVSSVHPNYTSAKLLEQVYKDVNTLRNDLEKYKSNLANFDLGSISVKADLSNLYVKDCTLPTDSVYTVSALLHIMLEKIKEHDRTISPLSYY